MKYNMHLSFVVVEFAPLGCFHQGKLALKTQQIGLNIIIQQGLILPLDNTVYQYKAT